MYTRCPHCTTIFRVTAEQLRSTHGEITCVTCAQSFNALDSLSDDITTLIATPDTVHPPQDTEDEFSCGGEAPGAESKDAETERNEAIDDSETPADEFFAGDNFADEHEDEGEPGDDTDTALLENEEDTGYGADPELPDVDQVYNETIDDSETLANDFFAGDDYADENEDEDEPGYDTEAPVDEPLVDGYQDDESEVVTSTAGEDAEHLAESVDSMEFDAPEQTWKTFFITNDAIAALDDGDQQSDLVSELETGSSEENFTGSDSQPWLASADTASTDPESFEFQTADQDEWQNFLTELSDDESDEPEPEDNGYPEEYEQPDSESVADESGDKGDPSIILPWLADEFPDGTATDATQRQPFRPSWTVINTCAALILFLAGQLIHYNRDGLAADATYGAAVRGAYSLLGAPLYPDWPLDAFEITGTKVIAGQSDQNALDILANVIVGGQQPVGLPLIRIVLRDRWASPVASRVFSPGEYLRNLDATNKLVDPGTALPIEISVTDPGAEALGYVVDVCLPRRKTGLECQNAKDPFQ